jgi:hypothetical protein
MSKEVSVFVVEDVPVTHIPHAKFGFRYMVVVVVHVGQGLRELSCSHCGHYYIIIAVVVA